ncbi:MAG: hypothetical protein AAF682_03665 [Planctomycetota bacterium]
MAGGWLDITDGGGERREALQPGLTRVGAQGDIAHPSAGDDEIHVWDQPPRAIYVGGGDPPTVDGKPLDEAPLAPGTRLQWRGMTLVYGGDAAAADQAALEEIPLAAPPPAAAPAAVAPRGLPEGEDRVWKRLKAGMMVELGLADRVAAKRWQDAVVGGSFNPDDCASEILARSAAKADDPRVLERSGRLLRDLLMAPLLSGTRGASRRARTAAKGTVAMILSQGIAFLVYTVIVLIAFLLLRVRGVSLDGFFDRLLMRG